MKTTFLLLFLSFSSLSVRIVHFNIKELDSHKIRNIKTDKQLGYAIDILRQYQPDILSINEIQYDLPTVPDHSYVTRGRNIEVLAKEVSQEFDFFSFTTANTGKKAKRKNGEFIFTPPTQDERVNYADQVNFGMFPAQYSIGGAFKFPIIDQRHIKKVYWKTFNKDLDLSGFATASGDALPENIELFDKSLSHVVLDIEGEALHVILLHTVPAFGFGNVNTPNFQRNLDQLRFLQRYLQGLGEGAKFVAMGDWNVDPRSENPGGLVIKELAEQFQLWQPLGTNTYAGSSFTPEGWEAQLDYILTSKNIKIKNSGVHFPEQNRLEVGCEKQPKNIAGRTIVTYRKGKKDCFAYVDTAFYETKKASDHLLLWADIEL